MNKWDGIDEFVAVARFQSFKQAAKSLGLSASHVSRAVMRLENRLNAPLFFRTTRNVTLTDTGKLLIEQCEQLLRDRDTTFALIGGQTTPQGMLRVTCALGLGEYFVAPILRAYKLEFPDLNITLDLSNRKRDLIGDGFDLAIRTGQLEESTLIRTLVARRSWRACASLTYIERNGYPKTPTELEKHICLRGTSALWHLEKDGQATPFKPGDDFRCNSGHVVLQNALAGMGICFLPEFYVRDAIKDARLIPVLQDYMPSSEPIWAVYPNRRHLQSKVYHLIERLRTELGKALAA